MSFLKSRLAEVIDQVTETKRPVIVTQRGEARAVLVDTESYEKTRRAIGLLKLLAQGELDVRAGQTVAQDELFDELGALLKSAK